MLERAIETTRCKQYAAVQHARLRDDVVILVDSDPRHDCARKAASKAIAGRVRQTHEVEINEEKSRTVDLRKGGSFGLLGFEFRRFAQSVRYGG